MEKITTASRVYKCQPNENVTLTFTAHNTDSLITYRFDDEHVPRVVQGNTLTFPSNKDLMILRVFFHFNDAAQAGGSYDVRLSGSAGGNFPDPPPVMESGDIVPIRRYAFVH
jgi:hypothetical protein